MTISSPDSYADLAPSPLPPKAANPLTAGLPAVWWPCVWGGASLVYSLFWMAESWRTARPLIGPTRINYLAQDLWCLILVLGGSYAVHQFCRHRSERLGLALCLIVAVSAMAWHRL
ncbi:hypothetical protein [Microvirga splendida]|uniref:Uncharacterized protein n=1 Tax=Microvirga splendida TaxID=2795727 RepID=A0ABS0Y4W6_9HYPH|nr:hypothetical protein [Microvirga splendida]MBJ6127327.1 hypothetical protein [Microvirga splendida]